MEKGHKKKYAINEYYKEKVITFCKESPYFVLFMRMVDITVQLRYKGLPPDFFPSDKSLAKHLIPLTDTGFKAIPWDMNRANIVADAVGDEYAEWIESGKDTDSFLVEQSKKVSEKKGLVIRKVHSISADFVDKLYGIAAKGEMQFPQVLKMFYAIKNVGGLMYSSHIEWMPGKLKDFFKGQAQESYKDRILIYQRAHPVYLSGAIPEVERNDFLLNICEKIYDLLQEVIWVLLTVDAMAGAQMFAFITLLSQANGKKNSCPPFLSNDDLGYFRTYLSAEMCFPYLESTENINSLEDMLLYIRERHHAAYYDYFIAEKRVLDNLPYRCSAGLMTDELKKASIVDSVIILSEKNEFTRRGLQEQLLRDQVTNCTVLKDALYLGSIKLPDNVGTILLLVDPFKLDAELWNGVVTSLIKIVKPGMEVALELFTYDKEHTEVQWPSPPAGLNGPISVVHRQPYHLAVYATDMLKQDTVKACRELGWSSNSKEVFFITS
jgi:hypothetical protein